MSQTSQAGRRSSALIICPPGRYREGLHALMDSLPCFERVAVADTIMAGVTKLVEPPPSLIVIDGPEWELEVGRALSLLGQAYPAARWLFVTEPGQTPPDIEMAGVLGRGFSLDILAETVRSLLSDETGFVK